MISNPEKTGKRCRPERERRCVMLKKALLALVLFVTVGFATLTTPSTADARIFGRRGWGGYYGGYYGSYYRPYYGGYYGGYSPYAYGGYYRPYYSGYYAVPYVYGGPVFYGW